MGANASLYMPSLIQASTATGGSIMSASATRAQGDFESSQARTNARLASIQAEDAVNRGEVTASEKARADAALAGSQRASLASQGVSLTSGSATDVQKSTQQMSELDQMTIRNNAAREAMGYQTQATNAQGRAAMAELAARNQARNTILTGGMNALAFTTKGYGLWRDKVGTKVKADPDSNHDDFMTDEND
jgi:hypothetical protein